ncbi:unnamed protein product, partial [Ilex paraguariensis]
IRRKRNTSCPLTSQPQATQPQTASSQPILPKQTKFAPVPAQHSNSSKKVRKTNNVVRT